MTPLHLNLMLHHLCSTAPFEPASDIANQYRNDLIDAGVLEYRDGIATATDKGRAWLDMLVATPIPEVRYVDPRFDREAERSTKAQAELVKIVRRAMGGPYEKQPVETPTSTTQK